MRRSLGTYGCTRKVPQFTLRAVVVGLLVGIVVSEVSPGIALGWLCGGNTVIQVNFSNMYFGLQSWFPFPLSPRLRRVLTRGAIQLAGCR